MSADADAVGATADMPRLAVSVVVPTRARPARLARLLVGLRAQTLARDRFEVVVVADGAGQATADVLDAAARDGELALRVVSHDVPRGPAAARNAGWRAARAPLVAFTDDDCVPSPGWLAAALEAAASEGWPAAGLVVQGRTEPDPAELDRDGLLSRTLRVERLGPQYETCNIVYPRTVLEALGGFDEGYGLTPGGEDTDLAWRAMNAGVRLSFAPDALVFHAVERLGARGTLRVAARWTGTIKVFAAHPQTRSALLYRGVFWNVWHYLLWRSLLVLPGPPWLRRLVLASHLAELRRRAHAAGAGSAMVPFLVLHDLVECYAVARGAWRYRTPVL